MLGGRTSGATVSTRVSDAGALRGWPAGGCFAGPRLSRLVDRLDYRSTVGEAQPAAQLCSRFIGRPAVERHQRPRASRHARDFRTPLVETDRQDFDAILAAIDDLFKTMHVHGVRGRQLC